MGDSRAVTGTGQDSTGNPSMGSSRIWQRSWGRARRKAETGKQAPRLRELRLGQGATAHISVLGARTHPCVESGLVATKSPGCPGDGHQLPVPEAERKKIQVGSELGEGGRDTPATGGASSSSFNHAGCIRVVYTLGQTQRNLGRSDSLRRMGEGLADPLPQSWQEWEWEQGAGLAGSSSIASHARRGAQPRARDEDQMSACSQGAGKAVTSAQPGSSRVPTGAHTDPPLPP